MLVPVGHPGHNCRTRSQPADPFTGDRPLPPIERVRLRTAPYGQAESLRVLDQCLLILLGKLVPERPEARVDDRGVGVTRVGDELAGDIPRRIRPVVEDQRGRPRAER